jgi:hypothetical protein
MSEHEYLAKRAADELAAAIATTDARARLRDLQIADAYALRLKEAKAAVAHRQIRLVATE